MTRKDELDTRAVDLASGPVSYGEVLNALLQVERECLERVEAKARNFSVAYDVDVWMSSTKLEVSKMIILSFADWCRDQLKEVER